MAETMSSVARQETLTELRVRFRFPPYVVCGKQSNLNLRPESQSEIRSDFVFPLAALSFDVIAQLRTAYHP